MRGKSKKIFCALFAALCVFLSAAAAADISTCGSISVFEGEKAEVPAYASLTEGENTGILTVLGVPVKRVDISVIKNKQVIAGGQSFGIRMQTRGVQVVGVTGITGEKESPAKNAGIRVNDIILSVNGEEINSTDDFLKAVESCGGKTLVLRYRRGGSLYETDLLPQADENGVYKAGIWVKDTVAGIGTVTYVIPGSNEFGGLGHGICETETGELLPFYSGCVYDAHITGVKRGKAGDPGELRGYFEKVEIGTLTDNTEQGVFGKLEKPVKGTTVPVGLSNEVKQGEATVLCTVDDTGVHEYSAEIVSVIDRQSSTKNFIIKITDEKLLAKTGGIVQGMSGSPILQNGKLVGAVTHVLVNDPSKGYGIFIENMLKYSE